MRVGTALATCALFAALGLTTSARAEGAPDTERAAVEYDAGARAFDDRDFRAAALAFERADALAPHPRTRYNAALSWDRAGDLPRAADAYAAATAGAGLDPDRVRAARARLDELFQKLGAIDVRRPTGGRVSVAHVKDAPIPARIHVLPGSHRLSILRSDGTREERDLEVHASERVVLEIAVTTAPLAPARPRPAAPAPPPPQPERETSSAESTWGYVALGGAVVFAAGATWFGIETFDAIEELDASGDRDAEARERAVRYRALGWASAGAAVACATLGIVLLGTEDEPSSSKLEIGTAGAGVSARYRF